MTQAAIDLIDRAFIRRLQGEAVDTPESPPRGAVRAGGETTAARRESNDPTAVLAPDAWTPIADEVEAAAATGCRVIAVVAVRRGEGCSSVARGAVRALAARGHRAACVTRPPLQLASRDAEVDAADIVIVDAGVWFPPGPIRRRHLACQAFGCDAVILVRRADRPPCEPQAEALVAIGLRVLGEVETFADDAAQPGGESPDV
jgi:hypothetical protein